MAIGCVEEIGFGKGVLWGIHESAEHFQGVIFVFGIDCWEENGLADVIADRDEFRGGFDQELEFGHVASCPVESGAAQGVAGVEAGAFGEGKADCRHGGVADEGVDGVWWGEVGAGGDQGADEGVGEGRGVEADGLMQRGEIGRDHAGEGWARAVRKEDVHDVGLAAADGDVEHSSAEEAECVGVDAGIEVVGDYVEAAGSDGLDQVFAWEIDARPVVDFEDGAIIVAREALVVVFCAWEGVLAGPLQDDGLQHLVSTLATQKKLDQ